MVVRVGHTYSALHPFVIFTAVELAPLVIGSDIGARSGFPNIFEFPCRRSGRVARLRGSSLGHAASRVIRDLLVLGMFLFKGCVQINNKLILIVTLLVPLPGRLVIGVQVDHVRKEGTGFESGGLFCPLAALTLDDGDEIPGSLA